MVEEKEIVEKITQVEENNEYPHSDPRDQQFVLLLRVIQANGRPIACGRICEQGHGTNDK